MKKKSGKWSGLVILCGLVTIACAFAAYVYSKMPPNMEKCITQQQTVSRNSRGDEVNMSEELCEGIASSATTTLLLTMNGTKTGTPFFTYDINTSYPPTFGWIDNTTLLVRIKGEGPVYKQLDHVAGVTIRYEPPQP